jgi:hypothetical protein
MLTLECGSGLSTLLFDAAGCNHTALEHNKDYAAPSDSVLIAPLVGNPPWYDWQPRHPYDLILIDGPPEATGGRWGILRLIDRLVKPSGETIIVLDDTQRDEEDSLANDLVRRFNLGRHDYRAEDARRFAVLQPSACERKPRVSCKGTSHANALPC